MGKDIPGCKIYLEDFDMLMDKHYISQNSKSSQKKMRIVF